MNNVTTAIFAGGCFWCTESAFSGTPGVISLTSGYTNGKTINPTYEDISTGQTGHMEALKIEYDAAIIDYAQLLEIFWRSIDPTDKEGQFADKGSQYITAIFYQTLEEKQIAESQKQKIGIQLGKEIATLILPCAEFYPAEDYHQNYHNKNALHYQLYKHGSGRVKRLSEIWGED